MNIRCAALNSMFNKKGVEMSMNVIVIAAIALIVLVVLVIITTGRVGIFTKGVQDCASKGGIILEGENTDCINQNGVPIGPIVENGKTQEGKICCVKNS